MLFAGNLHCCDLNMIVPVILYTTVTKYVEGSSAHRTRFLLSKRETKPFVE